MKKILTALLLAATPAMIAYGEEVTLNFADLGLDNGAKLADQKINDNLLITSTGNSSWNDSNKDFRLFSGGGLSITVKDATLTGVSITCDTGRGFGSASVTADSSNVTDFQTNPFSWTGEATESWTVTALSAANINVRIKSMTFTYTPKAVSQTLSAEILCKDMNVANGEPMKAGGYDVNEYVNVNFAQGSHAAQPTYMSSSEAFRLFNGQQVIVSAKKGAKLLEINIATTASNTFGYSGTVTADGVPQTIDTDFTWVPCKWTGSAEQNVVFQNGYPTTNTRVTGITVKYQTPGGGIVVARPEITPNENDNTVTIKCATEGASVYYTLDGTEPTKDNGTLYESTITLTEACTIKAIAYLKDASSSVASLDVYLRIVDSLKTFISNASPETVKIDCPVTAITTVGSYLMVKDNKGSFGIVRNLNANLSEALNVDNGTTWSYMTAKFDPYGSYGYIQPIELGDVSQETAVTPRTVSVTDFGTCVPFEYVAIRFVAVSNTGSRFKFTDTNGNQLDGYNRFVIPVPDLSDTKTKYDVTGFASNDPETPELWPVSFEVSVDSGIDSITEEDGNTLFFTTQGIQIDRPVKNGIYIKVKNGKATRMIIR